MKKLLVLGLLGLLFIGGMLHIQLVAQPSKTADDRPQTTAEREPATVSPVEPATFPLTFNSAEELAEFLKQQTPSSPTAPDPFTKVEIKNSKREIDQEKLKMLALAVHNHHDARGTLPSSATMEDGTAKVLHSWRVALLPYLEHADLHAKIHHDEPWDSEYNKQFHTQMPECYRSPYLSAEQAKKGLTPYVVIVGTLRDRAKPGTFIPVSSPPPPIGAIFPGPNHWNHFRYIEDGVSNTILFAQRSEPVCWMDPTGDVPIKVAVRGINAVKNGLGSLDGTEGISIAFADGAVRFAPSMRQNPMLEAALTCNGGESIVWEPENLPKRQP